ncbi:MAG: D-alanyl-D-alanine carboxypeptidase/D-alanyl-D-alanine-endopeptidase, partial [Candidatus Eisenbacteria sp.]|nr:D-alanyl-D-alanine carboxypeptidase/D-alanyl-D-alanine-endopeptidase [Candidatus Eisenbacteria bacterium]
MNTIARRLRCSIAFVALAVVAVLFSPTAAADYAALDWVVDSALAQPHLRGAEVAIVLESLASGEVLYERDADRPLIPASNMKVVTGAAALSVLGPDYRFETTVSTDAPELATTLAGNLYVHGTGDPSFVSEELWKLAESIRVLGIERIAGDLVLDTSYFDSLNTTSGAVAKGDRAYHARTGALSLNFNAIAVHTTPADRRGVPAVVELAPRTSFVELRGGVATGRSRSRSSLSVRRAFEHGQNVVIVSGSVPEGSDTRVHYRSLDDGPRYFGTVMREFLESAGVKVAGDVLFAAAPDDARTLVVHESKPLSLVVRDLNKFSNNFVAEQLVKALSAHVHGSPGTTAGGVGVLSGHLHAAGVDSASYHVEDGSGFSRQNRLTPRAIAAVIRGALSSFGASYEFGASLSVSGTDGTLSDRMGYPELEGAVRAKTGLLDGVTAISGVTRNASGEEVLFSIIVNGFDCEAW